MSSAPLRKNILPRTKESVHDKNYDSTQCISASNFFFEQLMPVIVNV